MSDIHAEINASTRAQLLAIIERVEKLEEEKKAIGDDIKDVFAEAKGHGFDVKAIRKIVSLRKKPKEERMEEEAILETYLIALGMLDAGESYEDAA